MRFSLHVSNTIVKLYWIITYILNHQACIYNTVHVLYACLCLLAPPSSFGRTNYFYSFSDNCVVHMIIVILYVLMAKKTKNK